VIRDATERSVELPCLSNDNIESMEASVPKLVNVKSTRLLLWLARKSKYPGDSVDVNRSEDYPLVYGTRERELWFFLEDLRERGLINHLATTVGSVCTITAKGWTEVEASYASNQREPKAFVAMSFSSEMDNVYKEGIKKAIEDDTGFQCIRVDDLQHNGKIDDKIIAEIKDCRFLVADFTGQRGGVYFEAGYAMGLGLPVIWLCREDEISKVHFDTRQYNYIVWGEGKVSELRGSLALRIRTTVGLGPSPKKRQKMTDDKTLT
jgi:nucleoside 2-deoxyribosyltransferase